VPARLPPSTDLRPLCSPVENQGQLGSCTGNAIAGAVELLERKNKVRFVNVSRLFIYYNERAIEHTTKSDSGAMIRDGIKTVVKQGVCSERKWPYVISRFAVKPTALCYKDALQHQVTSYQRILTVDEMRACLAQGFPFVFGFTVYESFERRRAWCRCPSPVSAWPVATLYSRWAITMRSGASSCATRGARPGE